MGLQNDILQVPQGTVLRQRFLLVDIQNGPEMACLQVSGQGFLIDDIAPGGIDKDSVFPHEVHKRIIDAVIVLRRRSYFVSFC